jgi:hypothetical protein
MDRPALRKLHAEVQVKGIDVIVAYKVDRLNCSITLDRDLVSNPANRNTSMHPPGSRLVHLEPARHRELKYCALRHICRCPQSPTVYFDDRAADS